MAGSPRTASRLGTVLWAWIRLGRFQFLIGGFVLYGLGLAIAAYNGAVINWRVAAWGQLIVTATQLMTQYCNDYFDFEADRHNLTPTAWSGGSRVLQGGVLPRQVALITAVALAVIALSSTALLAIFEQPGPLPLVLAVIALVMAWQYSAPPLTLNWRGVGEGSTVLVVTVLTPLFGMMIQHMPLNGSSTVVTLLGLLPVCCLQFGMLISVHLPDAEGDTAVGKHTLVVRFGQARTVRLYIYLLASAYALIWFLVIFGLPLIVAILFSLNGLMALWQGIRLRRGDWANPSRLNTVAFLGVAILICGAALELLAYGVLALS